MNGSYVCKDHRPAEIFWIPKEAMNGSTFCNVRSFRMHVRISSVGAAFWFHIPFKIVLVIIWRECPEMRGPPAQSTVVNGLRVEQAPNQGRQDK